MRLIGFLLLYASLGAAQTSLTLDGAGAGLTFQGVGAVSSGGMARLLIDYPEPQRGQILDYLFKPNYGLALQHLKVEIGSDTNSVPGAEPSHERSNGSVNCSRGYEWWLMQQAVVRNPNIILDSLMWGSAGWVSTFYSASNTQYVEDFLACAAANGLNMQYTGIWNEASTAGSASAIAWIKSLRSGLNSSGFSAVKLSVDDSCCTETWSIATSMLSDPTLAAAVDTLGAHYTAGISSANAQATGKTLWASEDYADFTYSNGYRDPRNNLRNYISGKMVKTQHWAIIASCYPILPFCGGGNPLAFLTAQSPWSGHYSVGVGLWLMAHITQFAQPGWQYLDAGSGLLNLPSTSGPGAGNGTYATLKNGSDYSFIVETACGGCVNTSTFNFTLTGGLSTGAVHVWKTTANAQFIQQSDIVPVAGAFTFVAAPDSIYSLTTTTGQAKGSAAAPAAAPFPIPYTETFESYVAGVSPRYFFDLVGAFETSTCAALRVGTCLRQVVTTQPIVWRFGAATLPTSYIGNSLWKDYTVAVDALLEQAGSLRLLGRTNGENQSTGNTSAYELQVSNAGAWSLRVDDAGSILASGTLGGGFGLNTWHTLSLTFFGTTVTASVDAVQIASVTDSTYSAGMAALGTSGFINAQFDQFQLTANSSTAVRGAGSLRGKSSISR